MTPQKLRDQAHFERLQQQAFRPLPALKPKQRPIVFAVPQHGRLKGHSAPFGASGVPMPPLNQERGQSAHSKSRPPPKMAPNFAEKHFAPPPKKL